MSLADVTGDGLADLITPNPDHVAVLAAEEDGGFRPRATLPAPFGPFSVVAADLNGDGRQDVAVASGEAAGSLAIWHGLADGSFRAAGRYEIASGPTKSAAADLTERRSTNRWHPAPAASHGEYMMTVDRSSFTIGNPICQRESTGPHGRSNAMTDSPLARSILAALARSPEPPIDNSLGWDPSRLSPDPTPGDVRAEPDDGRPPGRSREACMADQLAEAPPIRADDCPSVPKKPGLYMFTEGGQVMWVGRAKDLRKRIEDHTHYHHKGRHRTTSPLASTLANNMAARATGRRVDAGDPLFRKAVLEAAARIRERMEVRWLLVSDPVKGLRARGHQAVPAGIRPQCLIEDHRLD